VGYFKILNSFSCKPLSVVAVFREGDKLKESRLVATYGAVKNCY